MVVPDFNGVIRRTAAESTPWWPEVPASLKQAPNVVIVMFDDTGWSDFGCFGSEIATPTINALAAGGVRFSNFHVLPLCSPTRAAMLTGQNPHRVGMRFLADADTGFPNARGYIRPDIPTLPELLREAGYGTYLLGKWHLTPLHEITPAGPVHNWPLAKGFEKYYGFLDGCTDQYSPELYRDNTQVAPPVREGYHLTEDLADHAIRFLRDHVSFRPQTPFFLQFAVGATHAPFQAPQEYIEKYVDVFRKGWDQTRTDRLARQIKLGVVPAGTELADANPTVAEWASLDPETKELYAHLQAAFAGFLEHTDAQLGRLIAELDNLGVADNTIVIVLSDNGASREGAAGDLDTNAPYSRVTRPASEQLALIDRLGGIQGGAHYPEGWAMAGNTPFRRYKQFVDLGGIRSPMVVSWPKGMAEPDRVSQAFGHIVDIAPTILELAGLPGLGDTDGASLAPAMVSAEPYAGRTHQGYEMLGHRALMHDGWFAVTEHEKGTAYDQDTWRLYDIANDFSHAHDVAADNPERLAKLVDLWWTGAERNSVMPLDDRTLYELLYSRNPQGLLAQPELTLRPGQSHVPFPSALCGSNRSMVVRADLVSYEPGTDGALLASGNECSGYVLYVAGGYLTYEHHFLDRRVTVSAPEPLAAGTQTVGVALRVNDDQSAHVWVLQGAGPVADGVVPRTSGHLSFFGLDVGHDPVSPVSTAYEAPYEFPAAMLDKVTLHFTEPADMADILAVREVSE